jgi:ABC-type bacteriocin/lantibiotic exporter with double-glycine peptidase domain
LRHTLKGIFAILTSKERITLYKLILFDLVIGLLDIAFLGALLLIVNFYTKGSIPSKVSALPVSLLNPNSVLLIGIFCLLFIIKNWFGFAGLKSQHHFFYAVASRLSKRNMKHYFDNDYLRFVNVDSSVYTRNISQQPIEFSSYILTNFQQVVSQLILIIFTVCAILFYHPALFLVLFLLLAPPVVLLGWFIRGKLRHIRAQIKRTSEKTLQHLHESLAGYVESNIYDKSDFFTDRFHAYQQQLDDNIATQQTLQSLPSRLIEVFAVAGFFMLIAINKLSANNPAVDLLTIGIFMAAAYKIIPGIIKILNSTGQIKTYQFVISDLLLPETEKPDSAPGTPLASITSVQFQNIYFKHGDHQVLSNLSFNLSGGDFMGLSAPSGKGKTTVINLLLGFLRPGCGNIYINGESSDADGLKTYCGRISYVKQQPFFIHDSMLKNITLADGPADQAKLDNIISICGLESFLEKYPEGIEKVITENGKNISGGQRQRIMLARALYHDFDLLILDEPFGEIDDHSEKAILTRLQGIARAGKMILLITHNKSSLSFCNKMLLLDGE